MGILRSVAISEPRAPLWLPVSDLGLFHDPSILQWDLNGLTLSRLQSHCWMLQHPLTNQASLFRSAVLHFEFRSWCQQGNTRVVMPLAVFYQGMDHLQPTHSPPPIATKNSPGEKCYYKKGWLLCDSHCFIKKIFFFPNKFSVKKSKGFPKPQQNRTAHDSIFHRSATSLEVPRPKRRRHVYPLSLLCSIWPLG